MLTLTLLDEVLVTVMSPAPVCTAPKKLPVELLKVKLVWFASAELASAAVVESLLANLVVAFERRALIAQLSTPVLAKK